MYVKLCDTYYKPSREADVISTLLYGNTRHIHPRRLRL